MASLSLSAPFCPSSLRSLSSPSSSSSTATARFPGLFYPPSKPSASHFRALASSSPSTIPARPPRRSGELELAPFDSVFASAASPAYAQAPARAGRGAESDVMGMLLRERIVFLGSGVDDFVADVIVGQLLLLDAQDATKDIRLFINSPGGSLSAAMAIYDVIQFVRADVSTIAFGIAASTSSIILGGGSKGKRLAMPNTRIMIHQPLGGLSGNVLDVEVQVKEIMQNKDHVIKLISCFTGRTYEQVEKDIDKDRYMSPVEAMEYGILDGVINKDSIIPLPTLPEKVKNPKFTYEDLQKDPSELFKPEIPDDEIY